MKLGIIIYPNVQPMDVIGPWEVFATWKNLLNAQLEMFLISDTVSEITCDNGITLRSHIDYNHCPQLDYLIIPGGRGRLEQSTHAPLLEFIQKQFEHCKLVLSVCTGAFILYHAGVLKDEKITTYWRALPELYNLKNVNVEEQRVVKSEKIWASGGVSSGIDLALEAIAEIAGKETAGKVQLLFEYFPERKLFAEMKDVNELPPYYTNTGEAHLAEYIKTLLGV